MKGLFRTRRYCFVCLGLLAALGLVPNPHPAQATYKYWNTNIGWWEMGINWNPLGQPVNGDSIFLHNSSNNLYQVKYYTNYPTAVYPLLSIDTNGTGEMKLSMIYNYPGNNNLIVNDEVVGTNGRGIVEHSFGTHTVNNDLWLGGSVFGGQGTGQGTYKLSGIGNLIVGNNLVVGYSGQGAFIQTGGSNTANYLFVAVDPYSTGTYDLQGGSLTVNCLRVGYDDHVSALFKQSGGTHVVNGDLWIAGYDSASSGTYQMSGGSLSSPSTSVGHDGTGSFSQVAGWHTAGSLYLGYSGGSRGTYTLSTTGKLTAATEHVGYAGDGTFTQSGGTHTVTTSLTLGTYSSANGYYNLSGGSLSSPSTTVGDGGYGNFSQTGGTHNTPTLILGSQAAGSGSYSLQGGLLEGKHESIGVLGSATFNQSGGTHTVLSRGYLALATVLNHSATYNLTGGSLSSPTTYVGQYGSGTFVQDGGTHTSTTLGLGQNEFSTGNYQLKNGTLTSTDMSIGYNGTGIFTQGGYSYTGGTATVSSNLYVGYNSCSSGSYTLNQGSLTAANEYLGYSGSGNFYQYGGTHTVSTQLMIAANPGSSGSYDLQRGQLTSPEITINPNGSLNVGSCGLVHVGGKDGLNNQGNLSLAGGTLTGTGPLVNNAFMSGHGVISGSGGFTNYGSYSLSANTLFLTNTGANVNYGVMSFGSQSSSNSTSQFWIGSGSALMNYGVLDLNGSQVLGGGSLVNEASGSIYDAGLLSSSTFSNKGLLAVEGNTTTIRASFTNSGSIILRAGTFQSGAITNTGLIQGQGAIGSNITNQGTIRSSSSEGGGLILLGTVANSAGGLIEVQDNAGIVVNSGLAANAGRIVNRGGSFDNNNRTLSNTGQISGYGRFATGGLTNQAGGRIVLAGPTGGLTVVEGNVTNLGVSTSSYGLIEIWDRKAMFTGDVVNEQYAHIKTYNLGTSNQVIWAGTFTNNGVYSSDPAENFFQSDLIIGATGYLEGGLGDKFFLNADFINHSTQNTHWNTLLADLAFVGGGEHDFYLTGADLMATRAGYHDNFAWGTLNLTGQTLNLVDGDASPGGALYVREIIGLLFNDGKVANIFGNGLNLYYLPDLPNNQYLGGLAYELTGGGWLRPATVVPVPGSLLLLSSGLLGLLSLRQRRSRQS